MIIYINNRSKSKTFFFFFGKIFCFVLLENVIFNIIIGSLQLHNNTCLILLLFFCFFWGE
jgi:hypothetical protein